MNATRIQAMLVGVTLLVGAGSAAAQRGRGARGKAAGPTPAQLAAQRAADSAVAEMQLVRETFSFRSSGRDPFLSLLKTGGVRPLITDVRLVGINYDPRYPAQSVVTLQDTTVNKRYTLKVNDEVGRIRVTEIRQQEVVLTLEEFGTERQVVLSLRRKQEDGR